MSKCSKIKNGLWLRLWVDTVRSRKAQSLSDNLFRWWINLLCLAKPGDGVLPTVDDIAWELRCTPKQAMSAIDNLLKAGMLDKRGADTVMHDWEDWQFSSDVSTERVRQLRKRSTKRYHADDETFQERSMERPCNASRARSETETETETETERETVESMFQKIHSAYPEHRRDESHLTQSAFVDIMAPLPDERRAIVASEILVGIERGRLSEEWEHGKGRYVPSLKNFLLNRLWTREYRAARQSESVADAAMRLRERREAERGGA